MKIRPLLLLLALLLAGPVYPAFTVNGRQLLRNGTTFAVQGVCYHPVPIGNDSSSGPAWGDYCSASFTALHDRDLPLLRALGANTVRVYGWDPALSHTIFLERCYNNGINPVHVLVNLWIDPATNWSDSTAVATLAARFATIETQLAGHPAVLAVLLGNETNPQNSNAANPAYWAALDAVAAAIKAVNPARLVSVPITDAPVAISTGDPLLPHIDFWSLQLYRGTTFGSFFTDFAARSTRPVVLTEFGLDAYDHATGAAYPNNGAAPAQAVAGLWGEILSAANVCAGGCVFEFTDDWTKLGATTAHDGGGFANTAFADSYMDEEWWGIYAVAKAASGPDQLAPRTLATRLTQMWNDPGIALVQSPVPSTVTTGQTAIFSVQAAARETLSYRWSCNGTTLIGATSATLTLANAQDTQAGAYAVTVSSARGSVVTGPATLAVLARPTDQSVTAGHAITLSAGAGGNFQWQTATLGSATWANLADNTTYTGSTSSTLTITSPAASSSFRYISTNDTVVTTSAALTLTVASALLPSPTGLAADPAGNLAVADSSTDVIQTISTAGLVSSLAGTAGQAGSTDGTGTTARFNQPGGLARTSAGVLILADTGNSTIRKITSDGGTTTVAGAATSRGNADGAAATFSDPAAVAVDANGNIYVADTSNHTIRKVTAAGLASTFAGQAGASGGADGTAAARFNRPAGVAVDSAGNVYVADTGNSTIRKITTAGTVTTIAGLEGVSGSADGNSSAAFFVHPRAVIVDPAGNVYVADTGNSAIRKISAAGDVSTLAGLPTISGLRNGTGDKAWFNQPQALTLDGSGNLYVADTGNAAIRKITPAGVVTTLALTAASPPSTGGSGGSAGSGTGPSTTAGSSSSGGGGDLGGPLAGACALLLAFGLRRRRTVSTNKHQRT